MTTTTAQDPVAVGQESSTLAVAKQYLERGWFVVPVRHRGKAPTAMRWPELRSTPADIEKWFDGRHPMNLGILCGEPSRLVVLDFDDGGAFERWRADHPAAAATLMVARDNAEPGRAHLYFQLPEGQPAPKHASGEGWDLLSNGHQVVAPPSVHESGGRYRFVNENELLPWRDEYQPDAPPARQADSEPVAARPPVGEPPPYVEAALRSECDAVAATPEGQRNPRLNRAAFALGQLVGAGVLAENVAKDRLLEAARQCGLPDREAVATVRGGLDKGRQQPRQIPDGQRHVAAKRAGGAAPAAWDGDAAWAELGGGGGSLEPLPPFPLAALPSALRAITEQAASTFQVPVEYPAFVTLATAGIAVGARTFVEPKPGVMARANLYVQAFVPSGERKSTVFRPLTEPLRRFEKAHLAQWQGVCQSKRIWAARVQNVERELAKTGLTSQRRQDLEAELAGLTAREPMGRSPLLLLENCTEEAVHLRLSETDERAALFSADARDVMQIIAGLYDSDRTNRDAIYLKAFDGDSFYLKRMGRELRLERPCLGLLLCLQVDKLRDLADNQALMDSGFIPRFVMLVPDSLVGQRRWHEGAIDPAVQQAYNDAMLRLLEESWQHSDEVSFPLADDARALWIGFYNGLEERLLTDLAAFPAVTVRHQSLPLRLGLIIAKCEGHACIEAADMGQAIELTRYVMAHSRRALGMMYTGLDPQLSRIVRYIRTHDMRVFSSAELRRGLSVRRAELEAWLDELTEQGYVRFKEVPPGKNVSAVFEANPGIWDAGSEQVEAA